MNAILFKEIIDKYELNDFIIIIIFKNDQNLRILSKLNLNNYPIISNKTFKDVGIIHPDAPAFKTVQFRLMQNWIDYKNSQQGLETYYFA